MMFGKRNQLERLLRFRRKSRKRNMSKVAARYISLEHLEDRVLLAADFADALYSAAVIDQYEGTPATDSYLAKFSQQYSVRQLENRTGADVTKSLLIENGYYLTYDSEITFQDAADQLTEINGFEYFHPNDETPKVTKGIPNDPLFPQQWHLNNTGQENGSIPGQDINAVDVWDTYTGDGVLIAILDDGLEIAHEDLAANVVPGSFDYSDDDSDPTPSANSGDNHGTAVGGLAGAVGDNGIGVSGSAPNASLIGLRIITGGVSNQETGQALGYSAVPVDVANNSWGPPDSGRLAGAAPEWFAGVQRGIDNGRGGLGTIYAWAGGNGGGNQDYVNYDPIASSRYTIAVGALNENGVRASYSEAGASLLVTTPGGTGAGNMTTVDRTGTAGYDNGNYTSGFNGTSAATPVASGVIALILEANPNLSWREVQDVLVRSARQTDPNHADWVDNGAGLPVNHDYGFGAIDAEAAVALALNYTPLPEEQVVSTGRVSVQQGIPDDDATGTSFTVTIDELIAVQHVELEFNATHANRGNLEVKLTSPDLTESVMARVRTSDTGADYAWTFTSNRHWGEFAQGDWTVTVTDGIAGDTGSFDSFALTLYGYDPDLPPPDAPRVLSPTDLIDDTTPRITWTQDGPNLIYNLQVEDRITGALVIDEVGLTTSSFQVTERMEEGSYRTRVLAENSEGDQSDWSLWADFDIDVEAPGASRMESPRGLETSAFPTYSWTAATNAETYELVVRNLNTDEIVIRRVGIRDLQYTHFVGLPDGQYTSKVRATNAANETGVFSTELDFEIEVPRAEKPVITKPGSKTPKLRPRIEWEPSIGAIHYEVRGRNLSKGGVVVFQEDGVTDTRYRPNKRLEQGTYRFEVRGIDALDRPGEWSDAQVTVVDLPLPGDATLDELGTVGTQKPTFSWSKARRAKKYRLIVVDENQDDAEVLRTTVVGANELSYTPSTKLPESDSLVALLAPINSEGELGDYSVINFSIVIKTPARPVVIGPRRNSNGTVSDPTPTYAVSAVANANRYHFQVRNLTTGKIIVNKTNVKTTTFTPDEAIPDKSLFEVRVRAFNTAGEPSKWSKPYRFESKRAIPDTPVMYGPTGNITNRFPVGEWENVASAEKFQLFLKDLNTGSIERYNVKNWEVSDDGEVASFQVPDRLRKGTYQMYVRALGSGGSKSGYSNSVTFTIVSTDNIPPSDLSDETTAPQLELVAPEAIVESEAVVPVTAPAIPAPATLPSEAVAEVELQGEEHSDVRASAVTAFVETDWWAGASGDVKDESTDEETSAAVDGIKAAVGALAVPLMAAKLLKRVRNRKKKQK